MLRDRRGGSARGVDVAAMANPFACPTPPPPPDILVATSDEASGKSSLFSLKRRMTSSFNASRSAHDHRVGHSQSARGPRTSVTTASDCIAAPAHRSPRQSATSHSPRKVAPSSQSSAGVAHATRHSTFSNVASSTGGDSVAPQVASTSESTLAAPQQQHKTSAGLSDHALLYLDSTSGRLVSRLIPGREYYGGVYFAPPPTMSMDRVLTAIHLRGAQLTTSAANGTLNLPKIVGPRGAPSVVSEDSDASSSFQQRRVASNLVEVTPSRHHSHQSSNATNMATPLASVDNSSSKHLRVGGAPGLSSWAVPSSLQADVGLARPSRDFSGAGAATTTHGNTSFLDSGGVSLEATVVGGVLTPVNSAFRVPPGTAGGTIASRRQFRQPTVAVEEPI